MEPSDEDAASDDFEARLDALESRVAGLNEAVLLMLETASDLLKHRAAHQREALTAIQSVQGDLTA